MVLLINGSSTGLAVVKWSHACLSYFIITSYCKPTVINYAVEMNRLILKISFI